MEHDSKEVTAHKKAKEATAEYYVNQIIKDGWTVTHTPNKYDTYDLNITDGNTVFYTETKIRDINPYDYIDEGALVDVTKIDGLSERGKSLMVEFFPITNEAYVWNVADKRQWKVGERTTRKTNYTQKTVKKKVYYLPFDDINRRNVDMSDYDTIFSDFYNKFLLELN